MNETGSSKNETGFSNRLRVKLHEIIFEADTPTGKVFDVLLMVSILASVVMVMLDSVSSIRQAHGELLYLGEWIFTLIFTIEYILRLICIGKPKFITTKPQPPRTKKKIRVNTHCSSRL